MTRFRVRHTKVEAEQWTGKVADLDAIRQLAESGPVAHRGNRIFVDGYPMRYGDWLVKDPDGMFRCVDAAEFDRLYHPDE